MAKADVETSEFDSIINVLGFSPTDPLDTFSEMWYHVFLWALFSSLLVHAVAGGIATCMLRQHKIGRFVPVTIVLMGVLSPLTGGVVTSKSKVPTSLDIYGAAIAGVYRTAHIEMAPSHSMAWGAGQTVLALLLSFTRILATL